MGSIPKLLLTCQPQHSSGTVRNEEPARVLPVHRFHAVSGGLMNASNGEENQPPRPVSSEKVGFMDAVIASGLFSCQRSHPTALALETGNIRKRSTLFPHRSNSDADPGVAVQTSRTSRVDLLRVYIFIIHASLLVQNAEIA